MQLDVPLKELFDRSVSQMRAVLPDSDNELWDVASQRRDHYAVHGETRSIVFKWLDNAWRPGLPTSVKDYDYAPKALALQAQAFGSKLAAHFRGRVVKLMLAELRSGAQIPPHRDAAPALILAHRCHLPITTNPEVDFFIDGVAYHLQAGKAYEFDNTREHAVANRSGSTRVHLICDVLPN
jgi:hypothetical protein